MRALTVTDCAARYGWTVRHAAVPGRVRLGLPELKRTPAVKAALERELADRPDVTRIAADVWSGSLLLVHSAGETVDDLLAAVKRIARDAKADGSADRPGRPQPARRSPAPATRSRPGGVPESDAAWRYSVAEVAARLESDAAAGLPETEAAARRARYGPNALAQQPGASRFAQLVGQVNSLPVYLLLGSAAISVATGGLADAVAIVGIVAVNAVIGYVTERQAERTIAELSRPSTGPARVYRDGKRTKVPEGDLVPGDLIELRPGSYVPADGRLVRTDALVVDESALTGESLGVAKTTAVPAGRYVPLADQRDMVFKGTVVTGGQGLALVTATGMATEIGGIQALTDTAETPRTPAQRELDRLGKQLVWVSGGVCLAVFAAGLFHGVGLLPMLNSSIALAVAAVPEGLPAMAVTTLALGIREMRRYGVLTRRLNAVETLGSVQTICLDKTGTLTHNRMTVAEIRTAADTVRLTDGGFFAGDTVIDPQVDAALRRLLAVGVLCSDAKAKKRNGTRELQGSATETALLRAASQAGIKLKRLRKDTPVVRVAHRRDGINHMRTWHRRPDGGTLIAVKGAPREVLAACTRVAEADGTTAPLTDERRAAIAAANTEMARNGQRVLGFAFAESDAPPEARPDDMALTWLGLVGLQDPIRAGIRETIANFHRAGIATVMLTGDQRETAAAIARDLDLGGGKPITVVDAHDLAGRDGAALGETAAKAQVFARVTPRNKLDVVRALQARGQVVAMTGDGINDSPALKAADVGIAMGRSGTPVARDVADVVLAQDNLDDMVTAIHRGRTIYRNIRKAIRFLLSTNASEILVMFAATAAGRPAPLTAMQLLWINLATDVFPALGLALEPPDADIMRAPPRDPQEPIVPRRDLWRIGRESLVIAGGSLGAYGAGIWRYGPGPQAQTMACLAIILGQLGHAVTCRSHRSVFRRYPGWRRRNPYLDAGLGGTLALQGAVAGIPALRGFFGFAPLAPAGYGIALMAGGLPFVLNNLLKGRDTPPDWASDRGARLSPALAGARR